MIGYPKTRKDLQEETGLKGKALTAHLKQLVLGGVAIRRLAFSEPSISGKRQAVYQQVPQNLSLL